MAEMKILYVSGTYCPSHGGAEISMHTLLKYFQKNFGTQILSVTDERFVNGNRAFYDEVELLGIKHKERETAIQSTINLFQPNLLITQLTWSDVALKLAKKNNICSIIRVCKVPFELDIGKNSETCPKGIWCASKAVEKHVKENWRRDATILFPPIELNEKVIVPKAHPVPIEREYITFFNPLIRKGGQVFKDITKQMPEVKFATIYGWSCLKTNKHKKTFSSRYIQRITESEGAIYDGKKPSYVNLKGCPNISIFEPTEEVSKIYAKTRLLIIPSQWEEAFGRVAIEAMANGIPVIGSNIGGLKEAIGSGGVLVTEYRNPHKWVKEIKKFDCSRYYSMIVSRGNKRVKNYSFDDLIKNAYKYCEEICAIE